MKQETRWGSLARRAAVVLLFVSSAGGGACRGSPPKSDGGGAGDAGDAGIVCYAVGGGRCPCGISDISGTTPDRTFAATKVSVGIEGSACPEFGSLDLSVWDDPDQRALAFSVALGADAGPDPILGAQTVSVTYRRNGPALTTSGVVTITAADDPRAAYANYFSDAGVWSGMVKGSLAMFQDGFSLSGTFEGWYCSTTLPPCALP